MLNNASIRGRRNLALLGAHAIAWRKKIDEWGSLALKGMASFEIFLFHFSF